jgi:hypothetical protein
MTQYYRKYSEFLRSASITTAAFLLLVQNAFTAFLLNVIFIVLGFVRDLSIPVITSVAIGVTIGGLYSLRSSRKSVVEK